MAKSKLETCTYVTSYYFWADMRFAIVSALFFWALAAGLV